MKVDRPTQPPSRRQHRSDDEGRELVRARRRATTRARAGSGTSGKRRTVPSARDGYPAPIWDKRTGVIDKKVAAYWKEHYDLRNILETNWATLGPKVANKINVYVGDADSYFLNMGVHMLENFLKSAKNPAVDGRDRVPADGAALLGAAALGADPEDGGAGRQVCARRGGYERLEVLKARRPCGEQWSRRRLLTGRL